MQPEDFRKNVRWWFWYPMAMPKLLSWHTRLHVKVLSNEGKGKRRKKSKWYYESKTFIWFQEKVCIALWPCDPAIFTGPKENTYMALWPCDPTSFTRPKEKTDLALWFCDPTSFTRPKEKDYIALWPWEHHQIERVPPKQESMVFTGCNLLNFWMFACHWRQKNLEQVKE